MSEFMPIFETTNQLVTGSLAWGSVSSGLLAQGAGGGGWIDQLLLIGMVGLAVFAVCRSTRRQ